MLCLANLVNVFLLSSWFLYAHLQSCQAVQPSVQPAHCQWHCAIQYWRHLVWSWQGNCIFCHSWRSLHGEMNNHSLMPIMFTWLCMFSHTHRNYCSSVLYTYVYVGSSVDCHDCFLSAVWTNISQDLESLLCLPLKEQKQEAKSSQGEFSTSSWIYLSNSCQSPKWWLWFEMAIFLARTYMYFVNLFIRCSNECYI